MFPTLYKKNSIGKLMQWDIAILSSKDSVSIFDAVEIVTRFGHVGGKIQETADPIWEGKNIGKINETSILEQATAEAQSKWQKQKDRGYVEDSNMAKAGLDEVKGFKAMLAQSFEKHEAKIKFPAAVQPKLDGIRCLAIISDGEVKLFSRGGKPITSVPHIEEDLLRVFNDGSTYQLDGELYNHSHKDNFENLVSVVRKQKEVDQDKLMQYHIYDMNTDANFGDRSSCIERTMNFYRPEYLKSVPTHKVKRKEEVEERLNEFLELGYEGGMIRNIDSPYEGKRSYHLQKIKNFMDDEFKIVDVEEGRGKLVGHAIFICSTNEGKIFKAKMKGSISRLRDFFEDSSLWKNKKLTVKFFGYTTKESVPRFPVGIEVRDYE